MEEEPEPTLAPVGPMQIRPSRELPLGLCKRTPAVAMHHEERRGEARSILATGTFEQEGAWRLVASVEKVGERFGHGQLARIEPYITMHDSFFRADARFVPPPEIARIGSSQIDQRTNSMRAQERPKKPGIGLGGTCRLAPLDPVKIVGKIENQGTTTV